MKLRVVCQRCAKTLRIRLGVDPRMVYHQCRPVRPRWSIAALEQPHGLTADEVRSMVWAALGGGR